MRPSAGSPPRTTARLARRAGPAALVAALLLGAAGCGGGGDDEAASVGEVITTSAGTVIARTVSDREGLKIEAQGAGTLYVESTKDTPADVLERLRGQPIEARCTLRDGGSVGPIDLIWRDESKDWGAGLEVQGVYRDATPFAEAVRSCDLSDGTGELATGVFAEE